MSSQVSSCQATCSRHCPAARVGYTGRRYLADCHGQQRACRESPWQAVLITCSEVQTCSNYSITISVNITDCSQDLCQKSHPANFMVYSIHCGQGTMLAYFRIDLQAGPYTCQAAFSWRVKSTDRSIIGRRVARSTLWCEHRGRAAPGVSGYVAGKYPAAFTALVGIFQNEDRGK